MTIEFFFFFFPKFFYSILLMLGCCRCLCSREYSAFTRIESCYSNDGRFEPIYARVTELVNWGNHDVDRFGSIHEILSEKINYDINRKNDAGISVGLKIFSILLERVREINLNISTSMTNCIIQLIQTRRLELFIIAQTSTQSLLEFTQRHTLNIPVQRIIQSYLQLLIEENLKESIFSSIALIISNSSLDWIPLNEIFIALRPNFLVENSSRSILVSISKVVIPLTLPRLCNSIFLFFNNSNLWNNDDFLTNFLILILSEMNENCSPAFFIFWLEQLPPKSPENGNSKSIINIAIRLIEQVSPNRLISQSQTEDRKSVV